MIGITRSALVQYSARQMFDLVADVGGYARFLPWCRDSRVVTTHGDHVTAEISVARGPARFAFTTENTMDPPRAISIHAVDGPFRVLTGEWRFEALGAAGSKVSLELSFEFKNRIIARALAPLFKEIANRQVDAFCTRAKQVYGD